MKRKITTFLLLVAILAGFALVSIPAGTGDGTTFSPDAVCTRAQMVRFLYRYFVK